MDTIILVKYKNNTNFTSRLDSVIKKGELTRDHFTVFTPISNDYDYKIYITSTGQKFQLTGIDVESEKCNCGHHFDVLKGYSINGQKILENVVKIKN